MGLLDRFRSARQQSVLPDEVREYYQSGQRQRRGVAIALAAAALIVTVLLAMGVFFGVRAIYRAAKNDDKKPATSQNEQGQTSSTNTEKSGNNSSQAPSGQGGQTQNNPQTAPTGPAPAPTSSQPNGSRTPSLGDEQPLPHTGDEGM